MKHKMWNILVLICVVAVSPMESRLSPSTDSTCGVSKVFPGKANRGQGFQRGSNPWIVALMDNKMDPPEYFCGGTLLSSSFVLSAAHCFNPKESNETRLPQEVLAIFGAHDLNDHNEAGRFAHSPKNIIIHDDWNPHAENYDANLALLEFEEGSIHFDNFVQPVCLWKSNDDPTETEGIMNGWGSSNYPAKEDETVPKVLEVLLQNNEECLPGHGMLAGLSSFRTFCARRKNISCHGVIGGGLFIKSRGVYYLKGIASLPLLRDNGCDVPNNTVYSNVLKFTDWITGKIEKAVKKVFCRFKIVRSKFLGDMKTCVVNQPVDSGNFVLGSEFNTTVQQFFISDNEEVKFLPRQIGEKFPHLKIFRVNRCGLKVVRDYYFKDMRNLHVLCLNRNKITTIEPKALQDLIRVEKFFIDDNMIETLDENVFAGMVNLQDLSMRNNKISYLSPITFAIPDGKLGFVDLQSNVCIDKQYTRSRMTWKTVCDLQNDIRTKCPL